jgi:HlyD family secretion protein
MIRERKELDRRWLWLGAAVVLVLVYFSIRALTRQELPVRIVRVERLQLTNPLNTNAHVEPVQTFSYASPVSAVVKAVYVQEGDVVPAGKLLIAMNDMEARARLATAESGVKFAQASLDAVTHNGTLEQRQASSAEMERDRLELDHAQGNLDALTKLSATGAASAAEVTQARQQLATAQANLNTAQQSSQGRYSPLEVARAQAALTEAEANAAAARDTLSRTQYRAPEAGTVYMVDAKATEYAEAGKILLQMADLHRERIRAYFDEPDLGKLAVGQPVQIKWDAKPGDLWHGHIERTPVRTVTYTTRTVGEVLVSVDGGDGELLPDTDVTVTVTTSSQANAITVPHEALYPENGKMYVFKLVKGSLKKTLVTTGTITVTQAAILSGLEVGDEVATGTTSGQPLQEGMPIKRVQ